MFQLEVDNSKHLLKMAFAQHVTLDEMQRWRTQLIALITGLQPGFRLLSDLSNLEIMDPDCAAEMEFGMDLCNKAGVSVVVRVIPDPRKDIGLTIMSAFHYHRGVRIVTCETLAEALQVLEN